MVAHIAWYINIKLGFFFAKGIYSIFHASFKWKLGYTKVVDYFAGSYEKLNIETELGGGYSL